MVNLKKIIQTVSVAAFSIVQATPPLQSSYMSYSTIAQQYIKNVPVQNATENKLAFSPTTTSLLPTHKKVAFKKDWKKLQNN